MTAGRRTPNIVTRRLAEKTGVIFEFQREIANGEWKGTRPCPHYRIRSPKGDSRWRYGRADRGGNFALIDD